MRKDRIIFEAYNSRENKNGMPHVGHTTNIGSNRTRSLIIECHLIAEGHLLATRSGSVISGNHKNKTNPQTLRPWSFVVDNPSRTKKTQALSKNKLVQVKEFIETLES